MNKLEKEVCRILDFPHKYVNLAFTEANNKEKLANSWLVVNGKLMFVSMLHQSEGCISGPETGLVLVEELDVFNPEVGLYNTSLGLYLVTKKTLKQWSKSFKPSNYTFNFAGSSIKHTPSVKIHSEMYSQIPKQIGVTGQGDIYFLGEMVGVLKGNVVYMNTPKYAQELLDFIRDEDKQWTIHQL